MSKWKQLVWGLSFLAGAFSADAFAQSANCQGSFTDPRYNNRTVAEVTTHDFGCRIISMAQQNLSKVDDFRAMCQAYGTLMDVNAVTASINSDLGGVLPPLRAAEAIGLLAAVTLHEMSFLREQRQFRNILDFHWVLQNGNRLESARRGSISRFRLRNMNGVGSTILYLNPQGKIVNVSSSDAPFGATLVGTVPERIKNSNGGGGNAVRPDIVSSTISSYIEANLTGCPNL